MLRDYQQDLYERTQQAFGSGKRRVLVVAPCGAGKSYLFAEMARNTPGDVLILTHRRELKAQHEQLLHDLGITNARVAMVLTEANHLGERPTPRLIITDEAHLSRSNSWIKVLDYYSTWVVGLTATPVRLDGKPLGDIYDALVCGVNTEWLIKDKRLAPYDYYAPSIADAEGLPVSGGDYQLQALEKLMDSRAIYGDAITNWRKLAQNGKTIAYCVSVKTAEATAEAFNAAGISAVAVSAKTPQKQRMRLMDDFRSGKYKVLCNVGIISEGVSINDVTCCMLLRPTQSLALYWQQSMRCMRYLPNKKAIIIDCVGNYTRNPMPGADVEWSLDRSPKKHQQFTSEGDFTVRVCPECYKTFKTKPVCPFCGAEYPVTPRELKAHADIELKRITAEEQAKAEELRKKLRQEVGRARTYPELAKIAQERGYSQGWIYHMLRVRGQQ